jgi:hypothetical protein
LRYSFFLTILIRAIYTMASVLLFLLYIDYFSR